MPYLEDMPATCKARGTNPEYPLDLIDSIQGEFKKGLNGSIFDPSYVLAKLETLTRHVKWLEEIAKLCACGQSFTTDEQHQECVKIEASRDAEGAGA